MQLDYGYDNTGRSLHFNQILCNTGSRESSIYFSTLTPTPDSEKIFFYSDSDSNSRKNLRLPRLRLPTPTTQHCCLVAYFIINIYIYISLYIVFFSDAVVVWIRLGFNILYSICTTKEDLRYYIFFPTVYWIPLYFIFNLIAVIFSLGFMILVLKYMLIVFRLN